MSDEESSSVEEEFSEEEELYEVEKVVDHRYEGKKIFYKVRWKGYPPNQDTWEPQAHLGEGCDEIIAAYFELKAETARNKQAKKKAAAQNASRNEGKGSKANIAQPSTSASTASLSASKSKTDNSPSPGRMSPTNVFASGSGSRTGKETIARDVLSVQALSQSFTSITTSDSTSSPMPEIVNSLPHPVKSEPEDDDITVVLMSTCTHQPEYEGSRAQDYEALTRRYEIRRPGDTPNISDSRRCITVLMSQLCDPAYGDLSATFEQLRECMTQWKNHQTTGSTNVSLITAILTYSEEVVLSKKLVYQADVNKSVPGNWTPLHFAAALHKFQICDWLLEERCWPDVVTVNRETPMTLAMKTEKKCVKDSDKLLRFINRLISFGANASHLDYAGKSLAAIAKRRKCTDVAHEIGIRHQRLTKYITSLMEAHIANQPDNLYLKEFFLEPQVITQPPGLTYTMKFKFKTPAQRCVARLSVAYCDCMTRDGENPIKTTTNGAFPFKSITLNGHSIAPANPKFMCVTLKAELVVGNNVLELELIDATRDKKPTIGWTTLKNIPEVHNLRVPDQSSQLQKGSL